MFAKKEERDIRGRLTEEKRGKIFESVQGFSLESILDAGLGGASTTQEETGDGGRTVAKCRSRLQPTAPIK